MTMALPYRQNTMVKTVVMFLGGYLNRLNLSGPVSTTWNHPSGDLSEVWAVLSMMKMPEYI